MAASQIAEPLILKDWENNYNMEWVRQSGFQPYMGLDENNPIIVKKQLIKGGQVISIPLVFALRGAGKGTGTLVGNEEATQSGGYDVKPFWHRQATTADKDTDHITAFDLLKARREVLKIWEMDTMRDNIVNALSVMVEASGSYDKVNGHPKQVFFSEATTANKNTWAAANEWRIVAGALASNYSATFATMAATLDTTDDTLTVEMVRSMKGQAKIRDKSAGRPSVKPIRTGDQGREYFVLFAPTKPFQDLQADMETINLDGRPRSPESNPVFQDGDLEFDGVIIREIPEIASWGAIGASSAVVYPCYLLGAQALALAWGQMPIATSRNEDDYGFVKGVGTESLYAVEKMLYTPPGASAAIDYGMVTGLVASAR
jgi:hypothetical protein